MPFKYHYVAKRGALMFWNYRVIQDEKEQYRIVEVFYDDQGNLDGWVDSTDTILSWGNYHDLKGTAESVLHAFTKPVLTIEGENNELHVKK